MMFATSHSSVSSSQASSVHGAAAGTSIVLGQSPAASSSRSVASPVVPGSTFRHFGAAPSAGTSVPARVRKAPGRLISLANARLAQGREIVPAAGNPSVWYLGAKRAFDVAGALGLLLLLGPIMLAAFVALCFTTRGRPIFCQVRLGYRGRPFTMLKFRTMVLDAAERRRGVSNEKDGPVFKNRRDPRVTRLGRLLRSTSIDEMPQLFNVLLGQMSLVGPRPPLATEVARYQPWQRRRLAVKPGLTCLWQVSGRSEIAFEQWVRMDLWYLKNQSLLTDLKLLAMTPASVLSRRGAY